jgi:hypothetical protein
MVFFRNASFSWLIFKNNMKSPLLKLHFTLLYLYIVLHRPGKSDKYIYIYIYSVLSDHYINLFIFTLTLACFIIYTYTECKSKPFTHTALVHTLVHTHLSCSLLWCKPEVLHKDCMKRNPAFTWIELANFEVSDLLQTEATEL